MIQFEEETFHPGARIKVIGVGGGGGNAINNMIDCNVESVEFVAANTDMKSLGISKAQIKLQIGSKLTRGLGAGANPEIGKKAAEEDIERITEILDNCDMVFITLGLGGGTGTGAAPVIAKIARDLDILTVVVATLPFTFEGRRRIEAARHGYNDLRKVADSIIAIPNQRLFEICDKNTKMTDAYLMADNVLKHAVQGITDAINATGVVNVDFSDVRSIMHEAGLAHMCIGEAEGENRAEEAARNAISSPLLKDIDISAARDVIMNITCGLDFSINELEEIKNIVTNAAGGEGAVNVIFGHVISPDIEGKIKVTVIATGFEDPHEDALHSPDEDAAIGTTTAEQRRRPGGAMRGQIPQRRDRRSSAVPPRAAAPESTEARQEQGAPPESTPATHASQPSATGHATPVAENQQDQAADLRQAAERHRNRDSMDDGAPAPGSGGDILGQVFPDEFGPDAQSDSDEAPSAGAAEPTKDVPEDIEVRHLDARRPRSTSSAPEHSGASRQVSQEFLSIRDIRRNQSMDLKKIGQMLGDSADHDYFDIPAFIRNQVD